MGIMFIPQDAQRPPTPPGRWPFIPENRRLVRPHTIGRTNRPDNLWPAMATVSVTGFTAPPNAHWQRDAHAGELSGGVVAVEDPIALDHVAEDSGGGSGAAPGASMSCLVRLMIEGYH